MSGAAAADLWRVPLGRKGPRLALTAANRRRYHRPVETSREHSVVSTIPGLAKALVAAIRPKQWTKNLLVFFALFFTIGEEWRLGDLDAAVSNAQKSTLAFVLFCGITGAVYLVNDILDAEKDRLHPRKRGRPIASGALPVSVAWAAAAALALPSLGLSFLLEPLFGWVALGYLALMATYSTIQAMAGGLISRLADLADG